MVNNKVIEVPGGLDFTGFYYPDILRGLLVYLRQNKDTLGLTDENPFEPHYQMLESMAYVGHLNNTRVDSLATEMFLDSAKLLTSVKLLLRLMGIELNTASPATATLSARLSSVPGGTQSQFVPSRTELATGGFDPIVYESPETPITVNRADIIPYVYGLVSVSGQLGTDAVVSSGSSIITSQSANFPSNAVGMQIKLSQSKLNNLGEFRIVEYISPSSVKVIEENTGKLPNFTNESGITWKLRQFTSNLSTDASTLATNFSPFGTGVGDGDFIYIGHQQLMTTQIDVTVTTPSTGLNGVWEYFDNERSEFNPKSVNLLSGTTLVFDLEPILGDLDRSGCLVKVTYLPTGEYTWLTSTFGTENIGITTSFFGQLSPSTDINDYHITSDWLPMPNLSDGTFSNDYSLNKSGNVKWDIPLDRSRSWLSCSVNSINGKWLRFRIVNAESSIDLPVFDTLFMDSGSLYLDIPVTQGQTIQTEIIGSSTGLSNQAFVLPNTPYLQNSETISVDETNSNNFITYQKVDSFLESATNDRHYVLEVDSLGQAKVIFSNGVNGKIPPAGFGNIAATYRVGGDVDGNVGAGEINTNLSGIEGIAEVFNPHPASGWRSAEGTTAEDLARVKRDAPARLRSKGQACTADDVVLVATNNYEDENGSRPILRAFLEEEAFGPKTAKLIVVGTGGQSLTNDQLNDIELYFNGDKNLIPPVYGKLALNQKLKAINYIPRVIEINAVVTWANGSSNAIANALKSYLNPLATESDDPSTYIWNFGGDVSYSKIHQLIHSVDPNIIDVSSLTINGASESFQLAPDELPITDLTQILITVQS